MKIDIAKVLAMSEEEFVDELFVYDYDPGEESLFELAFRLRDEAIQLESFQWACAEVYNTIFGYKPKPYETHAPTTAMWIWFATQAQPIHLILAALKAKEK